MIFFGFLSLSISSKQKKHCLLNIIFYWICVFLFSIKIYIGLEKTIMYNVYNNNIKNLNKTDNYSWFAKSNILAVYVLSLFSSFGFAFEQVSGVLTLQNLCTKTFKWWFERISCKKKQCLKKVLSLFLCLWKPTLMWYNMFLYGKSLLFFIFQKTSCFCLFAKLTCTRLLFLKQYKMKN